MNLSNQERVAKLLASLGKEPQYIAPYLRALPLWRRAPIDVALPWWSFSAVDFMKSRLSGSEKVFEFGSGGSTLFFAEHCLSIAAVEDNVGWHDRMQAEIKRRGLDNATLLLRPFDFRRPIGFETSDYLTALDEKYDVIIIDGQDWTFQQRPVCFYRAENFVKEGGLIIVDDSWRY